MRKQIITRAFVFSVFTLFLAFNALSAAAQTTIFPDLDTSHENYEAIMSLYENDIVDGYHDGTMKPDKDINRAELMKIIVESHFATPETLEFNRCFEDVRVIDWYVRYICYAESENCVTGYPDGTFKPGNTITNVEVLSMIFNSYGIPMPDLSGADDPYADVSINEWYGPYVWYAKENGIINAELQNYNPGEPVSRGEAFEILYRTLMHLKDLETPVTYTYNNLTFEHPGTYYLEPEGVNEGFILFENNMDDGIAFVEDSVFDEMVLGENMTIEEMFEDVDGEMTELAIKTGDITYPYKYSKIIFAEDDITYFFKISPKYSQDNSYYVIGHYTNNKARLDVVKMIASIAVE